MCGQYLLIDLLNYVFWPLQHVRKQCCRCFLFIIQQCLCIVFFLCLSPFLLCRFLTQGNQLILSLRFPFQAEGKAKFKVTGVLTQVTGTTCSCGRRLSYTKSNTAELYLWLNIFLQHVPRYIPAITQKGRGLQRKQTSKDQWFVKQWHRGVTVTSGAESNSSLYRKL